MQTLKVNIILGAALLAVAVEAGFHQVHELSSYGHEDALQHSHHDYYAHPHYKYDYKVHDPHTGDVKSQEETREGDQVKGHYMHHQPDGTILVVHYTADKHSGYNAHVQKLGKSIHPQHYHTEHHHPEFHHHF